MGTLDKFERWRFEGIALAVESASVRISIRRHEHVYPHTPGAVNEKLGRNLYVIDVSGRFDDNLPAPHYSDSLAKTIEFRGAVEEQRTGELMIPWIGAMRVLCEELELGEKNTIRSGLSFHAKFVEDMNNRFSIQDFINLNREPMASAKAKMERWEYKADIFSKIAAGVGFVLGIKDKFELYSALVQSKINYLEGLFREADALAKELNDPANITGLAAFMAMWETLRNFSEDIADKGLQFSYYTVPMTMTLQQLADAIYHDRSKAGDLLGLNVIEDSLNITAGTRIRYYAIAV